MSLDDLRKKIDSIDTDIVRLIGERIKIAREIGGEKRSQGRQVNDRAREKRVLSHIKALARSENLDQEVIEDIYQQIITACRRTQGAEVAFQGETGAYGEEATFQFFGPLVTTRPYESLEEVFKATERDEAQFGIIPVENSLEGSISQSYDLLLDSSLKVCGEIELRVVHCLIANPGVRLDSIKRVYSHPQALGQCKAFLKHLNCELIPTYDTAGSVKMIKVIAREIEDNPNNFTRFFILSREDSPPSGNDKTSIVFSVKDKPKALYHFLGEFAKRDINLSKIESRPTRHKPWEYNFYLDFDGHREDKVAQEALASSEEHTIFVKILGSYPKAK
jgi:chorismate mutase/prephenate dehydratase